MEKVRVELGERSYEIEISKGSLDSLGAHVKALSPSPVVAIVSNPTVWKLYGGRAVSSLKDAGLQAFEVLIPDGEEYKTMLWAEHILAEFLKHRLDRKSVIIALGGGVVGDIAGFSASVYMRGIRFVQVPTTLLSQVDSSVGGKTGVNHQLGKNMIGTFWQPSFVLIDIETLKTLPGREFSAGMAEVIKYGVIWDARFFGYLDKNFAEIKALSAEHLTAIIKRSCEIKAEVVSTDERESGLRAILNYGHTIGHAVETLTGYTKYLHGEAVAIGMVAEAEMSRISGSATAEDVGRIKKLLEKYGLPTEMPTSIGPRELTDAMMIDKKTVAGKINIALPTEIGKVKIAEVEDAEAKLKKMLG